MAESAEIIYPYSQDPQTADKFMRPDNQEPQTEGKIAHPDSQETSTPDIQCPVGSKDPEFSFDDFMEGRAFEYLYSIENPYRQAMAEQRLSYQAKAVGYTGFKKLFAQYKADQRSKKKAIINPQDGVTDFDDPFLELNIGEWTANELEGIYRPKGSVMEVACSHPILPARRLRSIDTSQIKYELRFKRGGQTARRNWTPILIDASDMASPTEIVKKLTPYGVSVTGGDRAKALVDFLRDVCDINYDNIPEVKCVSRMGWNEEGFAPYNGDAMFDGASAFQGTYNAIKEKGIYEKWLEEAKEARTYSLTARIVLAASFAAPLIEPLGVSPFFVHLWSTASGTGKSVGQMLGASVWADPAPGGAFFPTFRSTSVGFEMMAGFLHSLPLFIDELQLAKDHHGKVSFNVYELASGSGKLRSNRQLGLNYTPKWATTFITSGETPIVSELDGEGALNRVFEIECMAGDLVLRDGHRTSNVLRENYGFAGKRFVECLQQEGSISHAKDLYDQFFQECCATEATDKQAMAASALLVADALATEWIFQDGNALTVKDISEYLKTKARVSLMQRGYDALCDWVMINSNKMRGIQDGDKGECYGIVKDGVACIVRSAFNEFCADNGINPTGLLSHLKTKKLIQASAKGYTKTTEIGTVDGKRILWHCICVVLPDDDGGQYVCDLGDTESRTAYAVLSCEDTELPF